jgi:uncharacterized membrane protein
MAPGRVRILAVMLVAVLALAIGETFLSKGMKRTAHVQGEWTTQLRAVAFNGWVWAGGLLLLLHVALYTWVLRKADLSFALPLTAASYPLAAILAKFYLHEDVTPARWVGTFLITLGVALVAIESPTS